MIVGCYDLHLYCDYPDDSWQHRANEPTQFTGRTFTQAKGEAVAAGWKFSGGRHGRVLCPTCFKSGRRLPKAT